MAANRSDAAAVRRYLEALENNRPKRGRKRTAESVRKRLDALEMKLADAPAIQRLALVQQRLDLERELAAMGAANDLSALEEDFVRAAKAYGERKGISYAAWREIGVAPEVLKRAGIARTRRPSA